MKWLEFRMVVHTRNQAEIEQLKLMLGDCLAAESLKVEEAYASATVRGIVPIHVKRRRGNVDTD